MACSVSESPTNSRPVRIPPSAPLPTFFTVPVSRTLMDSPTGAWTWTTSRCQRAGQRHRESRLGRVRVRPRGPKCRELDTPSTLIRGRPRRCIGPTSLLSRYGAPACGIRCPVVRACAVLSLAVGRIHWVWPMVEERPSRHSRLSSNKNQAIPVRGVGILVLLVEVIYLDWMGLRIGELARRTGVGVSTLRAWENRFRFLQPSARRPVTALPRKRRRQGRCGTPPGVRGTDAVGCPSPECRVSESVLSLWGGRKHCSTVRSFKWRRRDLGFARGAHRYVNRRMADLMHCSVDDLLATPSSSSTALRMCSSPRSEEPW